MFPFTGMTSFYSELMKGIGASARIWELTDRVPQIPISGRLSSSPDQKSFVVVGVGLGIVVIVNFSHFHPFLQNH